MSVKQIRDRVHSVGAVDWDRRLFDALIPLPDGTTYNSYLVQGTEATALIEAVDPAKLPVLHRNLDELGVSRVDYLVTNHAEQDHSGGIPAVLERFPEAKVVCTPKCAEILKDHLHLTDEQIATVEDGEVISLGDRSLEFIHSPWVHWPETMMTYLREEQVLFSCDLFGSHLATSELYGTDHCQVETAAKRYYGEIMMPFARIIARHLERIGGYELKVIAPSHGPAYDDPEFILGLYRDWVIGPPRNLAVVLHVTMHGSTQMMTDHLVSELTRRGVKVEQIELTTLDPGKLVMALVDAATVLLGTPTVLTGPHPVAANAAFLMNAVKPKTRFVGLYGSYGWSTRVEQTVAGLLSSLKVEMLPSLLIKGMPREEDFLAVEALAQQVADKHREAGLL